MKYVTGIKLIIHSLLIIITFADCTKDDPSWNLDKTLPKTETLFVTDVKSTSAIAGIKVNHNGGLDVLEKGVCYALTQNPTVNNSTNVLIQQVDGTCYYKLNALQPNKIYYIRAFARNSKGIGYGNEISFTTGSCIPALTTNIVTNITSTSALCGGAIVSDGGVNISAKGVVWSTSQNPTISLSTKTNDGIGSTNFSSQITGLTANVKYFVRAYCTNNCSTAYGPEVSFTTLACNPSVTTTSISDITSNSAISGGSGISDGGVSITAKGIVWSTLQSPTIALSTKTNNGSGSANYSSQITGLTTNTRYYVRAYVTNNCSTSYGQELTFVSGSCLPSVTTNSISSISSTSATSGGIILSNGGVTITSKGVVWSTSQNPTISLSTKTNDGSGSGSYSSQITNLVPNTNYYVRAYATNSCGTDYGLQQSFTTTNSSSGWITLGSGNLVEATTADPAVTPFGTLYTDARHLYLIRASEIANQGGASGNISHVSFKVITPSNININNFKIKMGSTTKTELNDNDTYSFSVSSTYQPFNLASIGAGWVDFPLSTSFNWNGTSNILIEVCYDNSNYNLNSVVQYSNLGYYCNLFSFADNTTGCSLNYSYYWDTRPNMRLKFN